MFHVRFLRRALFALPVTLAWLPTGAANAADATGSAPDFGTYDCAAARSDVHNRHIGQVIENTYREWTEAYGATKTGRSIYCVTTLHPDSTQLTRAQAEELLAKSATFAVAAPTAESKTAASTPESAEKPSAVLPRGIEGGGASGSEPLTSTSVQPLNIGGSNNNAVLDLGFPKVSVMEKKSSAVEKPATIGSDDRIRVNDLQGQPWQFIGQLIVTWKDGTQSACTGTLVSQYVVLTAGQCAHNRDKGGFAARATFAPGQIQQETNGQVAQPHGARAADYVETNSRWTQVSGGETVQTIDSRSDFAAYYFANPWSFTNTFMPIIYGDTTEGVVNAAGYPVDAGSPSFNQGLWYASGLETTRSKNVLRAFQVREFALDVSAGENGGPFWTFDGTNRNLVGVVSYGGDEVAGGVWFTNDNKQAVQALVSWAPSQSAPTHVADDLHVPLVYPSNYAAASGYFRFYNPTPQAGSVTVTVADGNTGSGLGVWKSFSIPAFGSIQVSVQEVEANSLPVINPAGKDRYTLNVASNFLGYFQYVLFNPSTGWIADVAGCSNGLSSDVLHLNNVHTSLIVDYPSAIIVHNVGNKAGSAIIGVYATATGKRLGGVIVPNIPPNADAVFSIKDAENVLGITPGPTEGHYNLVLESDFQGYLQHILYNNRSGVLANMTSKCAMPVH